MILYLTYMEDHPQKLWKYIGQNSETFLKHFPDHTPAITQLLIQCITADGELGTGFAVQGKKSWALVTMNEYDGDTELSIRYHGGDHYDLYFSYYDDDKENYVSVTHAYTPEEIAGLPQGLLQLLQRTFATEESQTANGNTLNNS
jgi:hypothetical protein